MGSECAYWIRVSGSWSREGSFGERVYLSAGDYERDGVEEGLCWTAKNSEP